jgi:hypothetical protein
MAKKGTRAKGRRGKDATAGKRTKGGKATRARRGGSKEYPPRGPRKAPRRAARSKEYPI